MSKALVCDRCGKVCKSVSGMKKIEITSYITFAAALEANNHSLDLCEQCFDEFNEWITEILRREMGDDPEHNNPGI